MSRRQAGILVVMLAGVAIYFGKAGSEIAPLSTRVAVVPSASVDGPRPPPLTPSKEPVVDRRSAAAPARQAATEAIQPSNKLPAGTLLKTGTKETPWDLIAPGTVVDTIGPENAMELQRGMKVTSYPRFRGCAASYRPPESMKPNGWWEGNIVLDVESSADGYEIVDATVDKADFADDSLESCLRASYKGVRVRIPGLEPGKRYRINNPLAFAFGAKEKMEAP